tara:strand:+ start:207 stop:509 length:303 start_codon:yes stop_codon:yes gene_type:complete
VKSKDERDFENIIKAHKSKDLPFVEVQTDQFRGVAKNFYSLPVTMLLDLRAAQYSNDGSDLLILAEAAEFAFSPEDFERLQALGIGDFLTVLQAWINYNQ